MRSPLAIGAALAALILPASAAAAPNPADQPPFGGVPAPKLVEPQRQGTPPAGYELSARRAVAVASGSGVVAAELRESPDATARAFTAGPGRWQVSWFDPGGTEVAQVLVDDGTASIAEAWRDHQVEVKLARGYEDAVGRNVSEWWIWIPLCLLFALPFLDFRRPGRLIHLDLAVLLAFSLSSFFFNKGEITASVPLVYPVLAYVFARLLWIGARGAGRSGALLPHVPVRWLAFALVALLAGRVVLNIVDSSVIDIGIAGVVGADRITSGDDVYADAFAPGIDLRGDTYGPFNYLSYVPFELALPWSGTWDDVPAAHAAAIAFDLVVVAGLFVLGRRLRPGAEGTELGVAMAWGWTAFPYTTYALNSNTNDALVAALIVVTMLVLRRPLARGAALALAAAAKFGPLALAPLFAAGDGRRRWRDLLPFAAAFAAVWLLVLLPLLPDGGFDEFYDRSFGYQASRGSPFSIWGLAPSLEWMQDLVRVVSVLFGAALFLWPARRSAPQLAALAACALILTQVGSQHWFYFFTLWWLPLALVAMLSARSSSAAPQAAVS
jgi:hypothetical protein